MTATAVHPRVEYRASLNLLAIARWYALHPDEWPMAPRFNPAVAWSARLGGDDRHEVWLRTWWPGQGTGLHRHRDAGSAFVVVRGVLTEWIDPSGPGYHPTAGPVGTPATRGAGQGSVLPPRGTHLISNRYPGLAVSVHACVTRPDGHLAPGGRLPAEGSPAPDEYPAPGKSGRHERAVAPCAP